MLLTQNLQRGLHSLQTEECKEDVGKIVSGMLQKAAEC